MKDHHSNLMIVQIEGFSLTYVAVIFEMWSISSL